MKKVLVIDDNPTIVELIKYAVNLQGAYNVLVAYDGVQGLERVYTDHPDCVIIDVKMPRMDGYQLVRCLRGDTRKGQRGGATTAGADINRRIPRTNISTSIAYLPECANRLRTGSRCLAEVAEP